MDVDRYVDILAGIIERQHQGKRRNGEIWFLCPVHTEKTPSAALRLETRGGKERGTWFCQGCGAGGGIFKGDVPLADLFGVTRDAGLRTPMPKPAAATTQAAGTDFNAIWKSTKGRLTASLLASDKHLSKMMEAGIIPRVLDEYEVGLGHARDAAGVEREAYIFPWDTGDVAGIQSRFTDEDAKPRYKFASGSKPALFGGKVVEDPRYPVVVVVEGAKKMLCIESHVPRFDTVALASAGSWRHLQNSGAGATIASKLARSYDKVVFMLDPDATTQAEEAAASIPDNKGRVARPPMKPDDYLLALDHDIRVLEAIVRQAKPVTRGRR